MGSSKTQDLAAFSKALTLLYADQQAETLEGRAFACIHSLFDCDFVSFSSVDLRHAKLRAFAISPAVSSWPGMDVYQRFLREDPGAVHFMKEKDPSVIRISDLVSLRQYQSSSVYTEVFRPTGCNRRLGFAMQNAGPISLASTLNRRGRDFTDDERILFDLLRPHLLQASHLVHSHKLLLLEQERQRESIGTVFGSGMGEVDQQGRVHWLTVHAQRLLVDFFPDGPHTFDRLPGRLHGLLAQTIHEHPPATVHYQPKRHIWQVEGPYGRSLKVRLVATSTPGRWQLLLEEIDDAATAKKLSQTLGLTTREAEIVQWLKQGKTNWEISTILGITEKTVGKHLEHVFAKLRVENRAAVVRIALDACAGG